jgi:hypothetical protein
MPVFDFHLSIKKYEYEKMAFPVFTASRNASGANPHQIPGKYPAFPAIFHHFAPADADVQRTDHYQERPAQE